jgi:hypothetical protein
MLGALLSLMLLVSQPIQHDPIKSWNLIFKLTDSSGATYTYTPQTDLKLESKEKCLAVKAEVSKNLADLNNDFYVGSKFFKVQSLVCIPDGWTT